MQGLALGSDFRVCDAVLWLQLVAHLNSHFDEIKFQQQDFI